MKESQYMKIGLTNDMIISAMASYLRILKMAPWWKKFQSREDMDGASTDIRYRKPKAVEAALSREPCLPDASDVGNEFLLGSKVTLSEHQPSAANIDTEDEDFNRICRDIDRLVDEEGEAINYVNKLLAKPDGPITTKIMKRYPLFWRDDFVKNIQSIMA